MDFDLVVRDVLKTLRGKRSPAQMGRQLKWPSTRYYHLESGHASLSWSDFVSIGATTKAPLKEALQHLLYQGPVEDFPRLLKHLAGNRSQRELAAQLGVSRSVISRWKSGFSEPSFALVLRLMSLSPYSVLDFLKHAAGGKPLTSIESEFELQNFEKQLHYRCPWVAVLLLYMRTEGYKKTGAHQEGYLAKKIGISIEQEREALRLLSEIGLIEAAGSLFRPTTKKLSTMGDREGGRRIREYWTRRCLGILQDKAPNMKRGDLWGYRVFTVSAESEEKIRQRYLEFYQDLENLIFTSSSKEPTKVCLLNFQLLDVEQLPMPEEKEQKEYSLPSKKNPS